MGEIEEEEDAFSRPDERPEAGAPSLSWSMLASSVTAARYGAAEQEALFRPKSSEVALFPFLQYISPESLMAVLGRALLIFSNLICSSFDGCDVSSFERSHTPSCEMPPTGLAAHGQSCYSLSHPPSGVRRSTRDGTNFIVPCSQTMFSARRVSPGALCAPLLDSQKSRAGG